MTNLELTTSLIKRHTKTSNGSTIKDLSKALRTSPNSMRKNISILRKAGVQIIDRTEARDSGRPRKVYTVAKNAQEYYKWRVSQLEDVRVKRGAPSLQRSL